MYSRPKPSETDDDLQRMQEEFLKNKTKDQIKLAATVVSDHKQEEKNAENVQECSEIDIQEQIANTFEAIPPMQVGKIVEKHDQTKKVSQFAFNRSRGFPQAKRRDPNINSGKGSIFSQHMKKVKLVEEPMEIDGNTITVKERIDPELHSKSFIVTGNASKEIHEENVNKLKEMSQKEIQEERERLITTMDPALIAFLKSRRKESPPKIPTIREQNRAGVEFSEIETAKDVLNLPNSEKWLNFHMVETNKLAWMKGMELPKIDKKQTFEARFDFNGWLLPYAQNMTDENRSLFHHGEEAERPGYTLQELFQLARSDVLQQKIIALNSIANLLSLYSTGIYCDILELPVEQLFFVLRFCLDDNNTPSVVNASIKAVRNLIYNQMDELCLDCLLNFGLGQVQPILSIDDANEDDSTINDQQLAETNLIKCLLRTNILVRIKYILNTVRPPIETVNYCLDILIRLVRDSDFILNNVYKCDHLIGVIVENFLPIQLTTTESPYGTPLVQAVKFLRLVACRSKKLSTQLVEKYKIMDSVSVYLTCQPFSSNTNGLKLQIESFHLWSVFVHYNLSLNYFQVLTPALMELLSYHYKNTDLCEKTTFVRQGNVASLLVLLGKVTENNFQLATAFFDLILRCFQKWGNQFMSLETLQCGKLQIISAIFCCLTSLLKYKLTENLSTVDDLVVKILKSVTFANITSTIRNSSMFLNNYQTMSCSANLKTVETAAWYTSEHVVPIFQTNSALLFLSALSNYVEQSPNSVIKLLLLNHENIKGYINLLLKLDKFYLINNWFSKIEANFIMNLLKMAILWKNDVEKLTFYQLAVKSLSVFNCEQKRDIEKLLVEIIFSPDFYSSEARLRNLDLTENFQVSLSDLSEIFNVYSQVLGLKTDIPDFSTSLSRDTKLGNAIPIDWIYTPIMVLYANQQQNHGIQAESHFSTVERCLTWILIYETYFPDMANTLNATDRFCRLCCVFLASDNLFLRPQINYLLDKCLRNIAKSELNFERQIQGLSNFQDLYTQLLEQYQGVSYGDIVFGNFLLVPLAQRHNVQFRKTLWSEYMGVVQIFNVTSKNIICPVQSFLEPAEQDLSLLKCYRRALVGNSVRQHSVLFEIAKFHVDKYVEGKRKE